MEAIEALKLSPDNYNALIIKANALMAQQKFGEAEKDFLKLIKISPENPLAYYRIGLLKAVMKKYNAAYDYFVKAYEKNNKNLDVFLQIVRIHVLNKEFDKAHEFCSSQLNIVEENNSAKAIVYNTQAQIFLQQKNPAKAKQFFLQAIKANPKFISPYNAIAKIYLSNKEKDQAIEQYNSILKINPDNAFAHMMLGTIYDSEKKYDKAADHYSLALDIQPDYAPAANNLAYHLAVRTNEIDKALELARKAKANFPEDPAIADTLGLIYYKKALYKNAESEFTDSLKKLSGNAVVNFHLGRNYAKLEEKELAKKYLKNALKIDKNFEGHQEAEKLIAMLNQ
jgi:tetratricopeptide (TPR) repeat protein